MTASRTLQRLQPEYPTLPQAVMAERAAGLTGCETQPVALAPVRFTGTLTLGLGALRAMSTEALNELAANVELVLTERRPDVRWVTIAGRSVPRDVARIIIIAAKEAKIGPKDLLGESCSRMHTIPRQRAMVSVATMMKKDGTDRRWSLSQVSRFFNRDRSTLNHAIERFDPEVHGALIELTDDA